MASRYGFYFTGLLLLSTSLLRAQNYQALHGSSFAGSLGVANNPGSIVYVPYKWDVTLLAVQTKHSTNAVTVRDFSLLSSPANASVQINEGRGSRYFMADHDVHLLNARISLGENSAIAFGANLRSLESVKTGAITWQDSIKSIRQFMAANISNSPLTAEVRAATWAEIYGTYARTLFKHERGTLVAGLTVKINRGLAGGYLSGSSLSLVKGQVNGQNGYMLSNGNLSYGYSSNLDLWDSSGSSASKRKRFLQKTWSAISVSAGVEYILSSGEDEFDYDLKIGASLLDLGYNKFQYSPNSRIAVINKGNISDSLIEAVFENINSAAQVPDSLSTVSGSIKTAYGFYKIVQPARFVLNVDKRIAVGIFINAELVLPITPLFGKEQLSVNEMNLAALTPRFETRSLGLYLPITLTTRSRLWMGAAMKAGPVLLGIHNLANLFAKDKMQNGGAYLAINLRPWSSKDKEYSDGSMKYKGKRTGRNRSMGCPSNF